MNILVVGSGGREHALGRSIRNSAQTQKLFFAPGNAGTLELGENVPLGVNDFEGIKALVLEQSIDLVVVGPEEPLVRGLVDFFKADELLQKVAVVGPSAEGARLEGSKDFAKQFMLRHNIPTARYLSVSAANVPEGRAFMQQLAPPYVLKADGLAAGKGVLIIDDYEEASAELDRMLGGKFGAAGNTVVIEEFLSGIELSVFALTDGKDYVLLPEAKDYKRIGEGDTGLNTGGMGAVSPVPFADKDFMQKVEERIVRPTVAGIAAEGIDYKGFVFFGLIKVNNDPYVIEYNVRMGDPETEVVLPRLKNDLVDLLRAVGEGRLGSIRCEVDERTALTMVLVSGGYPDAYKKGFEVRGLDKVKDSLVFHAGTNSKEGKVCTNGGRVLALTSFGPNIEEARALSLAAAAQINFEGCNYRKDIGFDLIH
ncbi:phosphoribosylamine--glycine ligase [Geofilum rhodophaeum]|uniref:phosphoribosylamine--glycine ligase n=1 Tax=Geofilum rhodophaeum TaxID=1965019 RepID=UPI000B523D80|nr:phosphoribosylamine--glycine ligase [Geofilum rhodophaeum]